jgi:glutathione S-transferase
LGGREYLFGEFGAADCAAWPFLRYAVAIDPGDDELFHRVLHERMTLGERHARLRAWIARMADRPRA